MARLILSLKTVTTQTKITVHSNREQLLMVYVRHTEEELGNYHKVTDQLELRKNAILKELERAHFELNEIGIIVCRGGVLKPLKGGIYNVNEKMIEDLHHPVAEHESNLGAMIAYDFAKMIGNNVKAITVDPACTDELEPMARISGMPEIERTSIMHTLSQRTVAKNYARRLGKKYAESNMIVAHLGSGISVGAHCKGKVIDVNNGLDGDGPMSVTRTGSVPVGELIKMCYSRKYTEDEMMKKVYLNGGLKAYLGTNNAIEVEKKIAEGDEYAELVYKTVAYQIAKEIGALATVLEGKVDGILITGGLAYSNIIICEIKKRVEFIAPVRVYPGEREMEGLAANANKVLSGIEKPIEYI
jgi:butyrate kinase